MKIKITDMHQKDSYYHDKEKIIGKEYDSKENTESIRE
jgi:hypothetical protein